MLTNMPTRLTIRPIAAARSAGLTLVELLVALSIGLFLTLGLFLMMSDSSRTFKIQDDYARMQESAVTALRYLNESLRHAGFFGIAAQTVTLTTNGAIGAITNDCGNTLQSSVPVFGYIGQTQASINGTLPCIASQNFRDPSSVLVARLGSGLPVFDANGNGSLADDIVNVTGYANTIFVQADANAGWVFLGGNYGALRSASQQKTLTGGADAPIFPYQMHVYYIRPCSRPSASGGTQCAATDDNGAPIPTLVRQELQGTAMVERPLAEGVERFTIMYGIDTQPAPDGDGIADRYAADPTTVAADGWSRVVAIRVTLLVRSATLTRGYDDSAKSYDLDGDGAADFRCTNIVAAEPLACGFKRALFSQVIQVRNLAFRKGA